MASDTREVTGPAGPTGRLAQWIADTRLGDVPERVVERAKILILDGVGCGLLAAHLPWSERAVEAVLAMEGGEGGSVVWGWGRTLPAPAAALLNGTFVQGFELDDYHQFGPLHSESCVVPSVLATAELLGDVDGQRALEAIVLGFEVGPRVGITMGGLALVSRGFHCGPIYGTLASAAGAGKLRGLDARALEDAFGIAATQSSGLMAAQYEAMVKRMHSGFSTRSGLYAAGLAAAGYTGIKRVIERDYGGLASSFSCGDPVHLGALTNGLGHRWEVERIAIKPPYACMGGLHTSIDAIRELLRRRTVAPADVAKVEIGVAHAMYHHGGWTLERPAEVIGAQMNIAYAVAVTLCDGDAFVPQFTPERVNADDVWQLMERIQLRWDRDLDDVGPEARWVARVRVELTDGSVEEIERRHPWGGLEQPMTTDDAIEKYRRMATRVMSQARAQHIEQLVLRLEELDDIRELIAGLAGTVTSPFDSG
jgi:aconitate decarboxylase